MTVALSLVWRLRIELCPNIFLSKPWFKSSHHFLRGLEPYLRRFWRLIISPKISCLSAFLTVRQYGFSKLFISIPKSKLTGGAGEKFQRYIRSFHKFSSKKKINYFFKSYVNSSLTDLSLCFNWLVWIDFLNILLHGMQWGAIRIRLAPLGA